MSVLTKDLSPELLDKATEELGEDPSTLDQDVQQLRDAVLQEEGLRSRTDGPFLLRFLRAKKYDHYKALEMLKNYYKQRHKNAKIFRNLSAEAKSEAISGSLLGALPQRDKEGRAVIVFNIANWDPSKVSLDEFTAIWLLTLERLIEEPDVQINGIVSISIMEGLSMNHILQMTPFALSRMFSLTLESFPMRYKKIHIVKESKLYDLLFVLIKPMISKKMRERFVLHGRNLETLHQEICPEMLPEELGGSAGPFDATEWNKTVLENDDVFIKNKEFGYQTEILEQDDEELFPENSFKISFLEEKLCELDNEVTITKM